MANFTNIIYVNPKFWRDRLVSENNGQRARYFEYSFNIETDIEPVYPIINEVECDWDLDIEVYYTVSTKRQKIAKLTNGSTYVHVDGFRTTIKVAWKDGQHKFETSSQRVAYPANAVAEKLCGHDLNIFHSYTTKLTTVSANEKQSIKNKQVLKDKLGVEIELGDFVAHPTGTYGGGSSVHIEEVKTFGIGTVNGWDPKRLIVVRTNNKNKSLGW